MSSPKGAGSEAAAARDQVPTGLAWRRAESQLAARLGAYPGDQIAVVAPSHADPMETLAQRFPRVRFVRGAIEGPADPLELDAVLVVAAEAQGAEVAVAADLLEAWLPSLAPFGRWLELAVAPAGGRVDVEGIRERLRDVGFEKVRTIRVAPGRHGADVHLVVARWPGADDEEE